ncbi:MAG: hypothetical protein C4516_09015 [Oxalobacter sp.]|nr:MAG: hypothetical protein C4516_09015 [Oxalobacter sp.]
MQSEKLLDIPVVGRLMSPDEVRHVTQGRTDIPEDLKDNWYLCGDIPLKVWDKYTAALKHDGVDVGFRLSGFASSLGAAYATFTVQIGQSQVRFLVPLKGKRIIQFLGEAAYSGVMLMLAKDNRKDCFIRRFSVDPTHLLPLLGLCRSSKNLNKQDTMYDLVQTTKLMRGVGVVPSTFPEEEVQDVNLIVILPQGEDVIENVGKGVSCTLN